MTPEQVQRLIDSATQHQNDYTLLGLVVSIVVSVALGYFLAYLKEKGENAATKEDIAKITREIESVKTEFKEREDRLKAELEARAYYNKSRYDRESVIFKDLWEKLCDLHKAMDRLRPFVEKPLEPGETEELRDKKRMDDFGNSFEPFQEAILQNRPFYHEAIWKELRKLRNLFYSGASEFGSSKRNREECWINAKRNKKEIEQQIENICEEMRTRLSDFE